MPSAFTAFSSLYFATLLMLLGSGLLGTYLGLRLAGEGVSEIWIGLLMTGYYVGLVFGASVGHRLIAKVGHIRAFVASAGLVTASVLGHALTGKVEIWLVLRVIAGMAMMCQYMVLESWLNEQAESHQRGSVFAGYMVVTFLGLVLGQVVLTLMPELAVEHLILVAMCYSLCLIPVAVTSRLHPAPLHPAPMKVRVFFERIPLALTTVLVSGLAMGAFYGMSPVFASNVGLDTSDIGVFMAVTIGAGLIAQWPVGWLSDRFDRSRMIQINGIVLTGVAMLIALVAAPGFWLLVLTAGFGLLLFTLYPLAVALANDHVEQEDRVPLAAMLLVTFGVGASIGPLLGSVVMKLLGAHWLYVFIGLCSFVLVVRVRPEIVTGEHLVQEAPLNFMPSAGNLASSPLGAALDPRVDEQMVVEQMIDESEAYAVAVSERDADQAEHRPG
ncbi:MFS transporter [Halopseudomonas salegens]|uniref:Predicted arabinose efflux permease, MFS family n=1 Tax=Halopseudomonas salegens TaxID=1434072 RepID=A0A1H2GDA7_9GAMM|nr:MFS transporter [Halopseudomonas salegens]SDU17504.1 Predicted arabinose efflux permease, MFS family [Halopseudomonas salegens]